MNPFSNLRSLPEIDHACWDFLQQAADSRDGGWRLPVLGTVQAATCRQRIVVLREVQRDERKLLIHTHARSQKVADIQRNSDVTWLFYDHNCRVQLQLQGQAAVHTDDAVAKAMWESQPVASLKGYLGEFIPGTVSPVPESNLPEKYLESSPAREELMAGRGNFAVISSSIETADWLMLRPEGNLRAVFDYQSAEGQANWVAP